ncbi:NAD dependent epimerase/dehydratase [Exidia glandulosa HHB12029]|uniref:NAD dependent epimerase/dehydratase n=1 Tax=Exidia glandulosa HHB12029 TaxID=1314781 RepID=A0A165MGG2_EXIGL|nr:NAD dependent epimerase/dehydratase [Exidia glandulosa HHB12029]
MPSPSAAYLVPGATGYQGGAVARELLKAGHRVHALVRDSTKPAAKELEALGAVLFVGDYSNADAINKATVGAKGVFINPFPDMVNPEGEAPQVRRFVEAALAAGTVEHLVISTAFHVQNHLDWLTAHPGSILEAYYKSKIGAEEVVRNSGVKYWTVLRPPWLMHNYLFPHCTFHYPKLHDERIFKTALTRDAEIAHFDPADLGRFAAAAFAHPETFAGKEIELGSVNLSTEEVAIAISGRMGSFRAAATDFQNQSGASISPEELSTVKSYGIPLTTFTEFLQNNKAAVLATLKIDT